MSLQQGIAREFILIGFGLPYVGLSSSHIVCIHL